MGLLDEAIREHLELKRRRGADASEVSKQEQDALGPARRGPEPLEVPHPPDAVDEQPIGGEEQYAAPAGPPHVEPHEPEQEYLEPEAVGHSEPVLEQGDFEDALPPPAYPDPPAAGGGASAPAYAGPAPGHAEHPPVAAEHHLGAEEPPFPEAEPPSSSPAVIAGQETMAFDVASELAAEEAHAPEAPEGAPLDPAAPEPHPDDVLEETPEFLQETPEHDRLWFEQKPPRDFDFDK